jgi:F0F1-type ATP synthase assembly protein I
MSQQKSPKKDSYNKAVKFSAVAFEMAATVLVCVFIGQYLDNEFNFERPVLTAIFSCLGVLGAIFNLIRKVRNS